MRASGCQGVWVSGGQGVRVSGCQGVRGSGSPGVRVAERGLQREVRGCVLDREWGGHAAIQGVGGRCGLWCLRAQAFKLGRSKASFTPPEGVADDSGFGVRGWGFGVRDLGLG